MAGGSHDVFISYSTRDKTIADAVCAVLERHGIRCWIAPRDVLPGADWGKSIVRGIAGARIFVLVFSDFANASSQVRREVERAAHRELPIIPFRVEDVQPNESLEFFISTPHWLDAFTPPLERHAERLADTIEKLLGEKFHAAPSAPADNGAEPLRPTFESAARTGPAPVPHTDPAPDAGAQVAEAPGAAAAVAFDPETAAESDSPQNPAATFASQTQTDAVVAPDASPTPGGNTDTEMAAEHDPGPDAEAAAELAFAQDAQATAGALDELSASAGFGSPDTELMPEAARSDQALEGPPVKAAEASLADGAEARMVQVSEQPTRPIWPEQARTSAPAFPNSGLLWAGLLVVLAAAAAAAAFFMLRPPSPERNHEIAAPNPLWSDCRIGRPPDTLLRACTALIQSGKISPDELARALTTRGVAYYYKHELDPALQDENAAIRVQPGHVRSYVDRGYIYLSKGEFDSAISDYNTAIRLSPMAGAYNDRGLAYAGKKNYPAAIQDFTSAIHRDPKLMLAYLNRGLVYSTMGNCRQAVPDFGTALQLKPGQGNAYLVRGNCLQQLGNYDAAIHDYDASIRLQPNVASSYVSRAMAYMAESKNDIAVRDFSAALRLNPDDFQAYYGRGNAAYAQRNYDQAIADYSVAIRLNPGYPMTYCNRGNAYYAKRRYALAIADYNAAIRLKPDYGSAHRNRAMAERASGKTAAAAADEKKARQVGSTP